MMKVRDIVAAKGDKVVTTPPATPVKMLAHLLKIENIGAVVVSEDGLRVQGIVTERDIVHGLTTHDSRLLDAHVSEIMTREVLTVSPDDPVKQVMAQMTQRRVRHLPVVEDGRLAGLISIGDVVKSRLDEAELETNVMRDYVVSH